jgi:hypothetical protein
VCDLDVMGTPSKLRVIRKVSSLARARPTLLLSWTEKTCGGSGSIHGLIALTKLLKLQKNGQCPDETVRIKV